MDVAALKAFYVQLGTVVSNLIDMFPEDIDFPTFQTFIAMLQKTNPSLVVNTVYEDVTVKYGDKIDARDETFLMEYQGHEYGNDVADIFTKVKNYWSVLDEQTKDSLWQYIYILKELSKRAYSKTK
jgi:hypothetical protein